MIYLHSVNTYWCKVNYHFLCSTSKVDQHLKREVWGGKRSRTREGGTFLLLDKGSITANVNTLLQATGKQNQNDMPLFATKSGSSQNLAHSVFLMVSAQNGCVLLRARPFDIRQFQH